MGDVDVLPSTHGRRGCRGRDGVDDGLLPALIAIDRLSVLVDAADCDAVAVVDDLLARELPAQSSGLPVRLGMTWDPIVRHRVQADTVGEFAQSRLGLDPTVGMSTVDWLTLSGQSGLEVIAGPLFADRSGAGHAVARAVAVVPTRRGP